MDELPKEKMYYSAWSEWVDIDPKALMIGKLSQILMTVNDREFFGHSAQKFIFRRFETRREHSGFASIRFLFSVPFDGMTWDRLGQQPPPLLADWSPLARAVPPSTWDFLNDPAKFH